MNINKIISKLINDKASTEELEVLEQWKQESEENLKELNDIIKIQKASEDLDTYKSYDVTNALSLVESKITSKDGVHPELKESISIIKYLLIMIAIVVAGSLLFYVYKGKINPEGPVIYQTEFAGLDIDLKDGSTIYLDKSSILKLEESYLNDRVVDLNGRAFFTVNHVVDDSPFTVKIPNAEIRVIGTQFSVYTIENSAEIAVMSGIVEITSENRKVRLEKGDHLLFENNDFVITKNSDVNYYSWTTGVLTYENVPLKKVLEDLIWTYNIKIDTTEVKLPSGGCRITTRYQDMDLEQILGELNSLYDLEYIYKDDVIFVRNINCS